MTKIAILDDYIGVALEYGEWSALPGDAEITVYREAIPPERLVDELAGYEIMRSPSGPASRTGLSGPAAGRPGSRSPSAGRRSACSARAASAARWCRFVTPHIGYVTEQGFRTAWERMAEDVAAYLAGSPIRVVTDAADCPPMAPQ